MDGHLQQIGENAKKCSVILNLSLWSVRWRAMMCFRLISTHQDWAQLPHTISHIYTGLSLPHVCTGLFYVSFSIHTYTGLSLTHIRLRCALPSCLNNRDSTASSQWSCLCPYSTHPHRRIVQCTMHYALCITMHGGNETPQEPPDWCFV